MPDQSKPAPSVDRVVAAFFKVKAQRAAFTREANEIDAMYAEKLDILSIELMKHLNNQKVDSFQVGGATVYRHTEIKPAAADWTAIYKWIVKNEGWDMLEKRLKSTFIAQYMEANKGAVPPGVNVTKRFVARIRKLSRKKGKLPDGEDGDE